MTTETQGTQYVIRYHAGPVVAHQTRPDGGRREAVRAFGRARVTLLTDGFDPDISAVEPLDLTTGQRVGFATRSDGGNQ
jgi:hypothetical protein